MQNFAINGGSVNGDPQVLIDDSLLSLVVQAAGEGMRGIVVSGAAPVALSSSLGLAYMAKLSGQAGVTLSTGGVLTNGLSLVGAAKVQLKAAGDFLRWVMIEGVTPTTLELSGDISVVPAVSATFTMVMSADLELHIAAGRRLEGFMPVALRSTFQAYSVKGTPLSGLAQVQMAGIGAGNLKIALPPGSAQIQLNASGDSRMGQMLQLEGYVAIDTHVRGSLESWHYVYAGGTASIGIGVRSERHGTPSIPSTYIEAPDTRALRVTEENRRFTVPAERRI